MSSKTRFANLAKASNKHFVDEISKNENKPLIEEKHDAADIFPEKNDSGFSEEKKYETKKLSKRWSMLKDHASYFQIINEEVNSDEVLIFPEVEPKVNIQESPKRRFSSENYQTKKTANPPGLTGSTKWAALKNKNAEQLMLGSENTKQPVLGSTYSLDSTLKINNYNKVLDKDISVGKNKWGALRERTSLIVKPTEELNTDKLTLDENPPAPVPKLLKVVNAVTATKSATSKFREASQMRINLKERMRKIVQERLTVKQIFKRYVESSTLHGFCYVCTDTFLVRRLIWALLMILGAIYFIVKLRYGIEEYLDYPFSTLSTVDYVHELLFPAISLCATNSYLASQVHSSRLKLLYEEGRLPLDKNQSSPNYNMSGEELVKVLQNSSLTIESLLKYCDWIQQDTNHPDTPPNFCGPVNFTSYLNYKGEQCYTLNSGEKGHELLKVDAVGLTYGYELMFDLHIKDVIKNHQFSGMRIVIHNQDFPPQLVDGFLIPPGFKTYVKLGTVQSKSLPPPYSTECGTKQLKYYNIYSQRLCLLETLTDFTGELCKCRDVFMPENGLPFCSLQELYSCMYPAKESFSEFNMRKECPADCEERTYPYELSEARFLHNPPTGLSIKSLENLQDRKELRDEAHLSKLAKRMTSEELDAYIEDNIVSVIFFFGDTRIDYNEQEASNDFFQFLGNMGGEFGLMLGASLLTFVEFVDLFIFLIYHQMLRLHNLKKIPDIFTSKRNRNKEAAKKSEKVDV